LGKPWVYLVFRPLLSSPFADSVAAMTEEAHPEEAPPTRALTAKQEKFVEEYLIDLCVTQAAIRAGYSVNSASQIGSELMNKPHVQEAIAAAKKARAERAGVTQEWVLQELVKIAQSNMADYMVATDDGDPYLNFANLSRDQSAALQEVTVDDYLEGRGDSAREVKRVRFKLYDKAGALVQIGKHLGMFTERREVRFPQGVPVRNLSAEEFRELAADLVDKV
jgi:phage terminase small subunit